MTDKTKTLEFTTIGQGYFSGIIKSSQDVITSSEDWEELWQQHKSIEISHQGSPPVPNIDFTQYEVVAVFAGEKPGGGYSVEITSVSREDETIRLQVDYTIPVGGITSSLTEPFHIIQISRMT